MPLAILIVSMIVQFCAAGLAIGLMRKTGRIGAWAFVAGALVLMVARRVYLLAETLSAHANTFDTVGETIALLTSCLLLVAVWKIRKELDYYAALRLNAEDQAAKRRLAEAELLLSQRQAEEATERLHESEEQLRFLSDNLPEGLLYQVDSGTDGKERRFTYVSGGVERLHEMSIANAMEDARRIYNQIVAEDLPYLVEREEAAVAAMSLFSAEVRLKLPSGKVCWRYFASAPRRTANNHIIWDGVEIDITERKKAEEERQRIEALESLGTFAGGLAHDFNNLLMGIFGNIELARMALSPNHAAFGSLQAAHMALENARQLTTRLLTFAKGGHPVLEAVDLQHVIRDTVQFNLTGSKVAAEFRMPDDLWPVKADPGQLAQVIANLTINAKDAMEDGGTVVVDAQNVLATDDAPAGVSGDAVKLTVSDAGVGIPANIIGRIFEPYFTTKRAGSGLGLAVAHGIINRHNGIIRVDSLPGAGTTFTVYLPVDIAARELRLAGHGEPPSPNGPPTDTAFAQGRILLMDDEEVVRDVTTRMLQHLGYDTDVAADGQQTLEKYAAAKSNGHPFDITIMDLTIPGGMGGEEAIRRLLAMDPDAKVIVASGYSSSPILADYTAYGFAGCLAKPFQLSSLRDTLSGVMKPLPSAGQSL